jgi:hypothetical protein
MSTTFTLSHAGHRAVIHYGSGKVEPTKAHDRYQVVDPYAIRDRMKECGFTTTKIKFNRPGNVAYVEAKSPTGPMSDSTGDKFQGLVRFKFDHRGKSCILGAAGALRFACDNQFYNPPMRIHHCSDRAYSFTVNPQVFAWELLKSANENVQKLDALRGVRNGLVLILEVQDKKRLKERWLDSARFYARGSSLAELDMWGAIQALTHTQSPSLNRMASTLLGEHFNTLVLGDVPVLN